MRGNEERQDAVFSYVSLEQRVPADHPLRRIRSMVDEGLKELSPQLEGLYSTTGRPSIASEKLLRALLLQALYGRRSERLSTLGVSASRTQELIEAVRKFAHGTLQYGSNKKKAGSPATAVRMKKNSRRHAEATKKKSHTRQTKAHR
jgi:hypothetical protein